MLIGIDEVGRGCLAGPLVVGAVSLDIKLVGLKDSKLVKPEKRQILAKEIYALAEFANLGWAWPHEIDELGLTASTTLAIKRSLSDTNLGDLEIIIDGNYNYLPDVKNSKAIIKADSSVPAVSAASIIAKVARDNYMNSMHDYFPDYGFRNHVGYGTAEHITNIKNLGPSPFHRLSIKLA